MPERFGGAMEETLLAHFDALIEARGYSSPSEALREPVRQALVRERWRGMEWGFLTACLRAGMALGYAG